jgi:hypothetical protein
MKVYIRFIQDNYAGDGCFEVESVNQVFTTEKIVPRLKEEISLSDDERGEHWIVDYVSYFTNDKNELCICVACLPD